MSVAVRGVAVACAAACAFLSPFSAHAMLTPSGELKRAYVDIGCYESAWKAPGLSVIVR